MWKHMIQLPKHHTGRSIHTSYCYKQVPHPDDDAHPFALGGEGEDLQDVEGENLSRRSLQLQGVQVSVHQGQADALCPPHQLHLRKPREK